jgi:cell division inhibitor SulA
LPVSTRLNILYKNTVIYFRNAKPGHRETNESDSNMIDELIFNNPQCWRAKDWQQLQCQAEPSGFDALDALLPGQGWPQSSLVELLCPHWGMGELQLVLPLLKRMTKDNRWQLWLAPPFIPYAPAMQYQGIALEQTLVAETLERREWVWAMEQGLRSGACSLLLAWCHFPLKQQQLRRLQLAAEQGRCIGFIFLHPRYASPNSGAALRLALQGQNHNQARLNTLRIDILKRRSGWPVTDIEVELSPV